MRAHFTTGYFFRKAESHVMIGPERRGRSLSYDAYGWKYGSRTAKNAQLCEEDDWVFFNNLWAQAGDCFSSPHVL